MKRLLGTKGIRPLPVGEWLRRGLKRYFLWRYLTLNNDEPWLKALGVYNLQRQRNSCLRRGLVESAQQLEQNIKLLLESFGDFPSKPKHSTVILMPQKTVDTQPVKQSIEVYYMDSVFLARCWKWLVQGKENPEIQKVKSHRNSIVESGPEWACLVTGLRNDGARILSEMVPVCYSHQSAGGVALDLADFHRALRGLQQWGLSLHGLFHSHRICGSVSPSNIDIETQRHVLEPSYPAIQAVFSEDGYICFFSVNRPFEIKVFGKGIKRVEKYLYRLDSELLTAVMAEYIWTPLVPAR